MKTRALLLTLPLLALAACRDNGGSIQVQAICAPTASCTFGSTCDAVAMGNPRIDPTVTQYLELILQVSNELPDNVNVATNKTNTNDAHVDEAIAEYGGILSGKVVMGASGTIPASKTSLVSIQVIPAAVGASLPASAAAGLPTFPLFTEATVKLKLGGFYDDGSRFETADFPLTVEVASGGVDTCAGACPQPGQWPATCP